MCVPTAVGEIGVAVFFGGLRLLVCWFGDPLSVLCCGEFLAAPVFGVFLSALGLSGVVGAVPTSCGCSVLV